MKTLKAIANFSLNGVVYEPNDDVQVNTFEEVVRLNEKGFIEPLTAKDLQTIEKQLKKKED